MKDFDVLSSLAFGSFEQKSDVSDLHFKRATHAAVGRDPVA